MLIIDSVKVRLKLVLTVSASIKFFKPTKLTLKPPGPDSTLLKLYCKDRNSGMKKKNRNPSSQGNT
ncbi:hypothetical protein D3C78_1632930 [compost metagenome]